MAAYLDPKCHKYLDESEKAHIEGELKKLYPEPRRNRGRIAIADNTDFDCNEHTINVDEIADEELNSDIDDLDEFAKQNGKFIK